MTQLYLALSIYFHIYSKYATLSAFIEECFICGNTNNKGNTKLELHVNNDFKLLQGFGKCYQKLDLIIGNYVILQLIKDCEKNHLHL